MRVFLFWLQTEADEALTTFQAFRALFSCVVIIVAYKLISSIFDSGVNRGGMVGGAVASFLGLIITGATLAILAWIASFFM